MVSVREPPDPAEVTAERRDGVGIVVGSVGGLRGRPRSTGAPPNRPFREPVERHVGQDEVVVQALPEQLSVPREKADGESASA